MTRNKETKKSIYVALTCYLLWGFQPLYYTFKPDTEAMFLLTSRMLWAGVFVTAMVFITKQGPALIEAFKNKELMWKHLIPAALFNFTDWGIYMWAVMNGHVLDTTLGYYVGPIVVCLLGVIVFKEKLRWEIVFAIVMVIVGTIVSGSSFGSAPWIAISLMFCFSFYAMFMKGVSESSIVCTAVQLIMAAPFALAYIFIFRRDDNGLASMDFSMLVFLVGAGIVTVLPILLYASSVKKLPMTFMGFMQYLCPTFSTICGVLMHETISSGRLICYGFTWAGIIVYVVTSILRARKEDNAEEDNKEGAIGNE